MLLFLFFFFLNRVVLSLVAFLMVFGFLVAFIDFVYPLVMALINRMSRGCVMGGLLVSLGHRRNIPHLPAILILYSLENIAFTYPSIGECSSFLAVLNCGPKMG